MLLRAGSSLLKPRASSTALFVANSGWTRGYAKDNKNRPPFKKAFSPPGVASSISAAQQRRNPTEPAGSGPVTGPGPSSSDPRTFRTSGRGDYSKQQDEFLTRNPPDGNPVPQTKGGGPGPLRPSESNDNTPRDFSSSQDEFKTSSASHSNTAPQSTSPSAVDPAIAQSRSDGPVQTKPLPDLTRGIPSTLDAELDSQLSSERSSAGPLDLTESAARSSAESGGRGGGDLPRTSYISSIERRRNRNFNLMYAALLLFGVTGAVYLGRDWETEEEEKRHADAPSGWGFGLFYHRAKTRLSHTLDYYKDPTSVKLLPDVDPMFERPFTLVLSLEDLLVHSEWSREHGWRLAKRPGVDYFLRYLQQYYELVVFTSVPYFSAEPVLKKLDPYRVITFPLFREQTRYEKGQHVKDLSCLNRDLSKVILVDTVPEHAKLQPENAIILPKWKGNPSDKELVSLIPFLEYVATMGLTDTRAVLKSFEGTHIPAEFAARELKAREKFDKELAEERAKRPHRLGRGLMQSLLGMRSDPGLDGFEQSASEAYEQGKMPQDRVRERGQKNYEALEKDIREKGAQWLKEMEAEEKKMQEEQMKGMKSSVTGMFSLGRPGQS
ncbi:MAG: mitochondrial inner membrane protein required for protein import [Caeruleum heppii]|nr:MAG: mitochondrial inner membrane protein required for protein import [Caeruleum heppii]